MLAHTKIFPFLTESMCVSSITFPLAALLFFPAAYLMSRVNSLLSGARVPSARMRRKNTENSVLSFPLFLMCE